MNVETLLTSWGIRHHEAKAAADAGFRTFVCPRCGGAAKITECFDTSGDLWLECGCTADSTTLGRRFTERQLREWLGVDGGNGSGEAEGEGDLLKPAERSDAGNAELLASLFGDRLRFVHGPDVWRVWRGGHWAEDVDGAAERLALEAAQERLHRADGIADPKEATEQAKWAIGSRSAKRLRDCLSVAKHTRPFTSTAEAFDANPWALNIANGTLDLRTGDLREHDPSAMHSKRAPAEYMAGAECPRWEQFLQEVFDGDTEVVNYLRRAVGYSLTGDTREQVLFVLYGSGCNGKTTLLNLLKRLLGDYKTNTDFATLSYVKEKQAGVRDDLAALTGARLVTASEAALGMRFSEGRVKQLTGGDPVTARPLYGRYFDFTPRFKLWLSCNHRPTVRDTSEAFWRRVHLVPFTVSFRNREDQALPEKLAEELPGILAWAVTGCLEWQAKGLNPPERVKAATSEYRASEDVIGHFLSDSTETDRRAATLSKDLYGAYLRWCAQTDERTESRRTFGEALAEKGFVRKRGTGGLTVYHGLRLTEEAGE